MVVHGGAFAWEWVRSTRSSSGHSERCWLDEYGHFHHGDTAGGEFVQRVNASLWMFAQSIIDWRGNAWWNVAWHFVRGYHALFNRITLGASRLQELHADRLSALSYGPAAASEGLLHMVHREAILQIESQRAFEQAQHSRSFPLSPLRLDAALDRRQAADWVATVLKMPAKEDHSHPSLSQTSGMDQGNWLRKRFQRARSRV